MRRGTEGRSARRPIGTRAMATKNKPRGAKSVEHRTHLVRVQSPTRGLHRRGGGPAGHSPLKLPGRQHPRARRCARTPREQSVKATPRVGRPVRAAYAAQSDDTAGDRNRPDDRTAAPVSSCQIRAPGAHIFFSFVLSVFLYFHSSFCRSFFVSFFFLVSYSFSIHLFFSSLPLFFPPFPPFTLFSASAPRLLARKRKWNVLVHLD